MLDAIEVHDEDSSPTIISMATLVEAVTTEFLNYLNSPFVSDVAFYPASIRLVAKSAICRALAAAS